MMTWHIPPRGLPLRWALILVGIIIFFWMGVEYDDVWFAALLGVSFCGVALAYWLTGLAAGKLFIGWQILTAWVGFGAVVGAGGVTVTVLLMAFKDALHAHPFPDYPVGLLAALLQRTLVWGLAGAFIGAGVYGLWRAYTPR